MSQDSNSNNKKRKVDIKLEEEEATEDMAKSYDELLKELADAKAKNTSMKKELDKVKAELVDVKEKLNSKEGVIEESDDDDDDEEDPTEVDVNNPWMIKLHELREYLIMNGHCDVPRNYPTNQKLSNWVKWQRQEYGKKKLPQEKIQKLESIGFTWGKKFSSPPSWEEQLEELKKYYKAMKHCNVPINQNNPSPLAKWISNQRFEYKFYFKKGKDSILNLDQIEQLNDIGFNWKGPRL